MRNLANKLGAVAALAAVLLPASPSQAQPEIPPEVLVSVRAAATASRQLAAREAAIARGLGNPELAATTERKARQRADAALIAAVIAIIASNRAPAQAVIEAAVAEAPESRDRIISGVAASFPALAGRDRAVAAAVPLPGFPPPPPLPVGPAVPPSAVPEPAEAIGEEIFDPLEQVNRGIFVFNDTLDILILRPLAAIYGFILPEAAKQPVRNFFANFSSPVLLANDLLQLTFDDAAVTTGRFVINSTIGVLGLFEVAEDFGLEPHNADFGQTLHAYGVGQGLYVMLPLFGPSTARDALGQAVDVVFQPANYLLGTGVLLGLSGGDGLVRRESLIDAVDDLRQNSIDYYAAVRAAFYQDRATELRKGRADAAATIDALFENVE